MSATLPNFLSSDSAPNLRLLYRFAQLECLTDCPLYSPADQAPEHHAAVPLLFWAFII